MSERPSSPQTERHAQLEALAGALRPELHRYCARLMGSVIEGEDVVQDTFARAFVALDELQDAPPLRAWLFRIAHHRALDLLRSRAIRVTEPIESAHEVADSESPDPVEALMRREAVETAVQVRVSNELKKQGHTISPFGVRSVWLRHDLAGGQERAGRHGADRGAGGGAGEG